MNIKIKNNDKRKIITAKKLSSKDIMLMLNLIKTKNHMMKKTN